MLTNNEQLPAVKAQDWAPTPLLGQKAIYYSYPSDYIDRYNRSDVLLYPQPS